MAAGIDYSKGEVIVFMDSDLQNEPEDIGKLLEKIDEGYDVVSGWRANRQDKLISRKIPSKIANWLIARVTGVPLHDLGCSLKAYRGEVLRQVNLYGEMHRFILYMPHGLVQGLQRSLWDIMQGSLKIKIWNKENF
jgi:glycosyltransferase involved in cell wall biosynthesis